MSSPCRIARRLPNGSFQSSFSQFPYDRVAEQLQAHYPLEAHAKQLIVRGDLPVISPNLHQLIALSKRCGAKQLYCWQDGRWTTHHLTGAKP